MPGAPSFAKQRVGERILKSGSIITAGNGGNTMTKAQFTIYYDGGQQRYDLQQELKPHEQMWVDMGKLIRDQVPDRNGHTLPPDLMMGSYEIQDLTDRGVGSLFEGKVILDKTFGYVAYGCATCCGYGAAPYMYYDPIDVISGFTNNQDVWDINFCSSTRGSVLFAFPTNNWNTGNHAIATANGSLIAGVGVGSTTNFTAGTLTIGAVQAKRCPLTGVSPNGPTNVNKLTPSSHTYPNAPVDNCRVSTPFDAVISATTGAIHAAQDNSNEGHNLQVGAPVYAPESGTVEKIVTGNPHVNQAASQCAGQHYPANYIELSYDGNPTILVPELDSFTLQRSHHL
ncbi:MAG TPA: hypothetical protein VHT24_10555 [Pseudacidobacterium sp.]|nr:hypothetical protein [Pseudacidobacterium sp.]